MGICKKYLKENNSENCTFSTEQLKRIDEVENASFEFCKTLLKSYDMEWDMSIIGPVADAACDMLAKLGFEINYPAEAIDEDGEKRIIEIWPA